MMTHPSRVLFLAFDRYRFIPHSKMQLLLTSKFYGLPSRSDIRLLAQVLHVSRNRLRIAHWAVPNSWLRLFGGPLTPEAGFRAVEF